MVENNCPNIRHFFSFCAKKKPKKVKESFMIA